MYSTSLKPILPFRHYMLLADVIEVCEGSGNLIYIGLQSVEGGVFYRHP